MIYTKSVLEEQLRRGERLPVGWPWRLLTFMVIIFGMAVLAYVGMTFGYETYLNARIKNLDQKIGELSQSVEEGREKNLTSLYSQLVNVQSLLASHPMPSKILGFLEKNTHPRIYYSTLTLAVPEKTLKMEGVATDYNSIVEQAELFRRALEVKSVFLDDSAAREEGNVRFTIRLLLKPEIFKTGS